jgi:hypothetical protein
MRVQTSQFSYTLHHLMKMELTRSSETSAFNTQTPGKYPEDYFSLLDIHGSVHRDTVYINDQQDATM